jgi:exonuclease SbcD
MRVAILGDFHLGYLRFYEDSFSQAAEAFAKACERSDLVILVGDIFDTKTPKLEVIERSLRIFGAGKEKDWKAKAQSGSFIPVVAIHGTHERRQKDSVNAIQVLEAAGVWKNIHNAKAVFALGNERVAVQGLGGVPEEFAAAAMRAAGFAPEPGAFNILVFHQSIEDLIPGKGEMLSVEDLPPGFDIYACGHMHKSHFGAVGDGELIIPGSTVITQMRGEESGRKGFVVFDTLSKKREFVEIDSRPFFYKEIEVKEAKISDVAAKARAAIEEAISKAKRKPIVKIRVNGTLAKGLKASDIGKIEGEFSEKAFVYVDLGLSEQELAKSLELLRDIRGKKLSIREMGLEILKKKLAEARGPVGKAEELFDRLAEGKGEELAQEIARKS